MSHQLKSLDDDTAREYRIDQHFLELKYAQTPEQRRVANAKMVAEIAKRSPAQKAAMERARGLV